MNSAKNKKTLQLYPKGACGNIFLECISEEVARKVVQFTAEVSGKVNNIDKMDLLMTFLTPNAGVKAQGRAIHSLVSCKIESTGLVAHAQVDYMTLISGHFYVLAASAIKFLQQEKMVNSIILTFNQCSLVSPLATYNPTPSSDQQHGHFFLEAANQKGLSPSLGPQATGSYKRGFGQESLASSGTHESGGNTSVLREKRKEKEEEVCKQLNQLKSKTGKENGN